MTLRDVLQNADVFEEPMQWLPDRWLTADKDKLDEMNRSFVPFGRGSRMCLGIKYVFHLQLSPPFWYAVQYGHGDQESKYKTEATCAQTLTRNFFTRLVSHGQSCTSYWPVSYAGPTMPFTTPRGRGTLTSVSPATCPAKLRGPGR